MKNSIKYLSIVFTLTVNSLAGCNESEKVEKQAPAVPAPDPIVMIDPSTPTNIQPYALDANDNQIANFVTPYAANGYELSFSDEFNTNTLNTTKWTTTVSTKTRAARTDKGISAWFWRADHVLLNGTDLVLKASKFNNNTMYCGSVDSRNKFEPLYGYLEARIDNADIQKAVHTAFWMQGINQGNVDGTGNDGCEVDIFESAFNNGAHTQSTLHWDGYNPAIKKAWTKHWDNVGQFGANIHQGYHIIALEWTPTTLSFYYDGKKRFEYEGVAIPLVKEWLWLSVGASFGDGNFLSRPIGELTAAKVDWIRVYKKK